MELLLLLHVLLVAVAAARAPAAHAWGKEGHYMSFLTEEASTAVKYLLPGWAAGDLAETCSWADSQRFRLPLVQPPPLLRQSGGLQIQLHQ
nr:unnamed protein product [Digitaria exilis]